MSKYYYLTTQLPYLKFKEKPFLDSEGFLEEAEKWLLSAELEKLKKVDVNAFSSEKEDSKVISDYKIFEKGLRENIALYRKGVQSTARQQLSSEIKEILDSGDPLEVEEKILLFKWNFIEEKEKEYFFSFFYIQLYFLKLQILERLFIFNKEKGTIAFDALCGVD